jgi:hypothetical protein
MPVRRLPFIHVLHLRSRNLRLFGLGLLVVAGLGIAYAVGLTVGEGRSTGMQRKTVMSLTSKPRRLIFEPEKVLAADTEDGVRYTLPQGWHPQSYVENAAGLKITTFSRQSAEGGSAKPDDVYIMLQRSEARPQWFKGMDKLSGSDCQGICTRGNEPNPPSSAFNPSLPEWYYLKGTKCPFVVTVFQGIRQYYEFRFAPNVCPNGKFGREYQEYLSMMDSVKIQLGESSGQEPALSRSDSQVLPTPSVPVRSPILDDGRAVTGSDAAQRTCPTEEWIDCLPGAGPQRAECSTSYLQWARDNCPKFKGIAY